MSHLSLSVVQARYSMVMAGIQKHVTGTVLVLGATYSQAQLLQPFQGWFAAVGAVAAARAEYHAAVVAERALYKQCQTFWLGLQAYARNAYAGDTVSLADFGYGPVKHTVPGPEVKAAAALKSKATRAARHTMGKNQRKAITGAPAAPATPPPAGSPPVPATK